LLVSSNSFSVSIHLLKIEIQIEDELLDKKNKTEILEYLKKSIQIDSTVGRTEKCANETKRM